MKTTTRLFSLFLALILLLGCLSGCGKGGDDPADPKQPSAADPTPGSIADTGFAYLADYTEVSGVTYMNSCCLFGDRLYFIASVDSGEEESYSNPDTGESWSYPIMVTGLFSCLTDGSDLKKFEGFVAPEYGKADIDPASPTETYSSVNSISVDPEGNVWVLMYTSTTTYELPADFDPAIGNKWDYPSTYTEAYSVDKLDATGAKVLSVDLSGLKGPDVEYFYVNSIAIDGDGNLIISDGTPKVHVYSPEGEYQFSLDMQEWADGITVLNDGSCGVRTYDSTSDDVSYILKLIDVPAKSWGKTIELPDNAYNIVSGGGDYDLYYTDGDAFCGFDIASGEVTRLFNWLDSDVDSGSLGTLFVLPDGRIVSAMSGWESGDDSNCSIVSMRKVPASEVPVKETITLGCLYLDYDIRKSILDFNKKSDKYRIRVTDYSEYNTDDDYSLGQTKLTTEILAGQVPDILLTSNIPMERYISKGLFEDLLPYIDADSEIGGREALMQPYLNAVMKDGKLFYINSNYSIQLAAGLKNVVGDRMGWTLDELKQAFAQLPDGATMFSQGYTKADMLMTTCYMMLDNLIDWKNGTCTFDSDEFVGILEFCNSFPDTYDWEDYNYDDDYISEFDALTTGKQLLISSYISDFYGFQYNEAQYNGELSYVGYPTVAGQYGSAINLGTGLAMSSTCSNKDAAWSFMRKLLTADYQSEYSYYGIPTNMSVYNDLLKTAMTPTFYTDSVTGEKIKQAAGSVWIDENTEPIEYYEMSQAQADKLWSVISSTTRLYTYDQSIFDIISDECAAYFNGQKSASDTAKLIQSRVSIYVAEQS